MTQGTHSHLARTQAWRLTTAVRVFGLAFVVGTAASQGALRDVSIVLFGLATVATAASVGELRLFDARVRWLPIVESLVVMALLASGQYDGALAPYLLVPPVVAGARHGWVPALNAGLVGILGLFGGAATVRPTDLERVLVGYMPWAVLGLAAGLLAGWQTRTRRLEEHRQAPYSTANDLLTRLHELVSSHSVELDPVFVAERLCKQLKQGGTPALAVAATERDSTITLAGHVPRQATPSVETCLQSGVLQRSEDWACVPLSLGNHVVGAVVFAGVPAGPRITPLVHDAALRLETALRFRDVRSQATADERRRLSREIHDGVAQEVVALGYLVDELQGQVTSATARDTARLMRGEVERILDDLRASVHAWRTEGAGAPLASSLRALVGPPTGSRGPAVRVTGDLLGLPPLVHDELLGIAREAVGNARKHSHANHLWITLKPTADGIQLRIEDDGIGGAVPTPGHHGMDTMRERAKRIGAHLVVGARTGGGTKVEVSWPAPKPPMGGSTSDVYAAAGR